MSSSTVRVYTAPVCPDCKKQHIHIVDNPFMEVIERVTTQEEHPGVKGTSEYVIGMRGMSVARDYAVAITYRQIVGKSGKAFFVPDPEVPDMGGRIYVTDSEDYSVRGEGFGGGTIDLPLVAGGIFELKGGWHTNPQHLVYDTGVDLRDRNLTFVVISRGADYNVMRQDEESGRSYTTTVMKDVIYIDPKGGLEGYFMRGKHLAIQLAKDTNESYFLYSQSHGGSSFGRVTPTDEIRDPEDMW